MLMVAYFDRAIISIAEPNITAALRLTKTQFGFVLSAFSLGYAVMQVPGGRIADRIGARPLLILALIIWSAFTGFTGLAWSLAALIGIRVLFGVGEGIENGAQFKLLGDHFVSQERSRATAIFLTATALGPALVTPVSAFLLGHFGWRGMFACFTIPGLAVAALLFRLLPRKEPISPTRTRISRGDLELSRATTWLTLAGYLLFNCAFWGFNGWIPSYLREQRHVTLSHLGLLGATPYLCGFLGMVVMGQLGSRNLFGRRAVLVGGCYACAAVFFFVALKAGSTASCIAGLSAAAFFLYGAFGPFWGAALDLAKPECRGVFSGFINFGGQLGGFIGQIAIGAIADRFSLDGALSFIVTALICASLAMFVLQSIIRPGSALGGEKAGTDKPVLEPN